ncbi:MAG: Gp49 family protein [Bacteroidota bacterium]
MLNDKELAEKLEASPAERVTEEYMNGRIARKEFVKSGTSTTCLIHLDNGFIVSGFSACAKPENYRQDIGEKISYDNAYRQLWGFFGFLLVENGTLVK